MIVTGEDGRALTFLTSNARNHIHVVLGCYSDQFASNAHCMLHVHNMVQQEALWCILCELDAQDENLNAPCVPKNYILDNQKTQCAGSNYLQITIWMISNVKVLKNPTARNTLLKPNYQETMHAQSFSDVGSQKKIMWERG